MSVENGEWIMHGLAWDDPYRIRSPKELVNWINEVGHSFFGGKMLAVNLKSSYGAVENFLCLGEYPFGREKYIVIGCDYKQRRFEVSHFFSAVFLRRLQFHFV